MGIRYSKSIKIGDFVKLNISKSGVSATIGPKGASINLGSKGTYLNLSPSAAGIKGTGVSYRKKLTGGYGSLLGKLFNKSEDKKQETKENDLEVQTIDNSEIEAYYEELNNTLNIHKFADKVLTKDEFISKTEALDNEASKEIYKLSIDGDEDTIESLVGSFMLNLDLKYDVKANYELEDHDLYIDLDLPEIEQLSNEYPVVEKGKTIVKKKTNAELKKEYAILVQGLSIFLSANIFNLSSYIKTIIISGFTSSRDNNGDLIDKYLYSIKYTRDKFIETDFKIIENPYQFILNFENRINLNETNYTFKEIKPFEMESVIIENEMITEAIGGLKQLGYKQSLIDEILPELKNMKLESSSAYLKEALKLLTSKK